MQRYGGETMMGLVQETEINSVWLREELNLIAARTWRGGQELHHENHCVIPRKLDCYPEDFYKKIFKIIHIV